MAVHASHAALPYPIKGARFSLMLPYFDPITGAPTAPTTPDTEFSLDGSSGTDCAEEVSAVTAMAGMALFTVTGAETNGSVLALNAKAASGPGPTLATLYPRVLAKVAAAATLSAGGSSGGTLTTALAYDVTGCFVKTVGGTGGGGTGGANNQARKIITYNTSTGAFTVEPNFETALSTDTTVDILLPDGVTLGMLKALNPTTPGYKAAITATGQIGLNWADIAAPTTVQGLSGTTIKNTTDIATTLASLATAIDAIPTNAELTTALDPLPLLTELTSGLAAADDAILAALAAGVTLTAGAVDAILDEQVGEGTLTLRQTARIMLALAGGKRSGLTSGAGTVVYRNPGDTADRITAVVTGDGNVTSLTLTP